jgi:hypothetical protein
MMNNKPFSRALNVTLLLGLMFLLAACATTPGSQQAAEAETAVQQVYEIEPWEGDPMDMPMDGSSLEAFDQSLARFKAYATPEQYQGLNNAITWLLTYDIGANKDRATLASRLDGMTAIEIFDLVGYRKPAPGKSQIEKDAADAKIIDS